MKNFFFEDRIPALLAFTWLFLTTCAAYAIQPVRGALLLTNYGSEVLPWAYMASALATGAAVWVYDRFTHLPRRTFVFGTIIALLSTIILVWAAVLGAGGIGWVSFLFSLWMDVFSIMTVTLFWSAIDDIFTFEDARRFYGVIAAAGPLGAIAGSWIVKIFVPLAGLPCMVLIAAAVFACTLPVFAALDRRAAGPGGARKAGGRPEGRHNIAGIIKTGRMILSSRFLLFLTALVCLERMVPDLSNYLFTTAVQAACNSREDISRTFAEFGLWQNLLSFAISLALTGWAFRRLGVGGALATAPLANLAGFAVFAFMPTLPVAFAYNSVEGMFRYTWFKSAKESAYTVMTRDAVYQVKALVEMFLYRFSRGMAGFLLLILTGNSLFGLGPVGVAAAGLPLALAWLAAGFGVARELYRTRKEGGDGAGPKHGQRPRF